jgi:hypothetical protein
MNLFFGGEELDVSGGFWAEGEVIKPKLAISKCDERSFELYMMVSNEANFWASECETAFDFLAEFVIKRSATVDGHGASLLLFLSLFTHVL